MATVEDTDVEIVNEISEPLESSATLMALNSSEIDTQIATAKRYPRSIKQFRHEALQLATLTEEVAGECIYCLPRGGKSIEGPSARFAEIVASAWGNCRAGARVISEDDRFVTSQGVFIDMQKNVAITFEVKRRITDKHGNRFKDDMIGVTSNAASSIALRNAVLKGIPKAVWRDIYAAAKKTAIGDASTLATRRATMIEHFGKMGVQPEMIFQLLEVEGVEDITLDHLATLRGTFTSLREGDTTIEQVFSKKEETGSRVGKSPLNEKLDDATDPMAAIRAEIEAATESTQVVKLYDQHVGPESQLDEAERKQVTEWCEMQHARIQADAGAEQGEQVGEAVGDGLFDKGQPNANDA